MLRRLRLGFQCGVRRLGPLLVTLAAFVALGFGAHAALDWHRHGSPRAGFFHLHVHFGHHHHGEAERHGHDDPEPGSPTDDRRESGTLTLALGFAPTPAAAMAERPVLDDRGRVLPEDLQRFDRKLRSSSWSPRGPPV